MLTKRNRDSLIRRIRFAQSCRYYLDVTRNALGLRRRLDSFQWFYFAMCLAFDLVEFLRVGGRLSYVGRAQHAALLAPIRLSQDPRYRAYWYDSTIHAVVGVLLGIDLYRHERRYYLIECNLGPALREERRALYGDQVDPFISELIDVAKKFNFEQIILYRHSWPSHHLEDFARATTASNIRIIPVSVGKKKGDPLVNPLTALPRLLAANTMYVVCTTLSDSPIFVFLHQKKFVAKWFGDVLAEIGASRLAAVPTYDQPRVADGPLEPRWPNLVIKLASSDEGRDVLMGRFESQEQAQQALGLSSDSVVLPRQFRNRIHRYWIDLLFPGVLTAIYQPFVPPEVLEGFPLSIRTLMFISPITNACLSSHGTLGRERLPDCTPLGILPKRNPYNVKFHSGRYVRLARETEDELREVAGEFAEFAGRAIRKKFEVCPSAESFLRPPSDGDLRTKASLRPALRPADLG